MLVVNQDFMLLKVKSHTLYMWIFEIVYAYMSIPSIANIYGLYWWPQPYINFVKSVCQERVKSPRIVS